MVGVGAGRLQYLAGNAEPGAVAPVQLHLLVQCLIKQTGKPCHGLQFRGPGRAQSQHTGVVDQVDIVLGNIVLEPFQVQVAAADALNKRVPQDGLPDGQRPPPLPPL